MLVNQNGLRSIRGNSLKLSMQNLKVALSATWPDVPGSKLLLPINHCWYLEANLRGDRRERQACRCLRHWNAQNDFDLTEHHWHYAEQLSHQAGRHRSSLHEIFLTKPLLVWRVNKDSFVIKSMSPVQKDYVPEFHDTSQCFN